MKRLNIMGIIIFCLDIMKALRPHAAIHFAKTQVRSQVKMTDLLSELRVPDSQVLAITLLYGLHNVYFVL